MNSETVIILGASDKPERYAFKAQQLLQQHNHQVISVTPRVQEIDGLATLNSLKDLDKSQTIDTITLYLRPQFWGPMIPDIIAAKPRRVICNPGTEDSEYAAQLSEAGIEVLEACTLVMLSTGQF